MKDLLKAILCFLFIMLLLTSSKAAEQPFDYIEQYKSIAISEMERTGIPASIKLAQGILESNKGQSDLAKNANNHFGIKCGSSWTGNGYRLEDDDYNDRGELIKSCFRVYNDPYQSYLDHSDLLTGPKRAYRYGHLFDLDPTDYKAWAKGLRKSGYATDPKYPNKLIMIIEKYELYQYDQPLMDQLANDNIINDQPEIIEEKVQKETSAKVEWITNNEVTTKKATKKETYDQGADAIGLHKVKQGETPKLIARVYGITEKELYSFNRIPINSQIKVGSNLKVDGYLHWGDRAEYSEVMVNPEEDLLFANEVVESFK